MPDCEMGPIKHGPVCVRSETGASSALLQLSVLCHFLVLRGSGHFLVYVIEHTTQKKI